MNSKSKTFIVLGSGATVDGFKIRLDRAEFDPPMDNNFFDTPIVHKFYNQKEFPALHFFQSLKKLSSLEKTWSDIDLSSKLTNNNNRWKLRIISMAHNYKKLQSFFRNKSETKDGENFKNNLNSQLAWVDEGGSIAPLASWEAVELILKVYGDLKKENNPPLLNVLKCILKDGNLKGIATFNYDRSIELIWNDSIKAEKLYYYDPDLSVGYTNGIPLYKLHGSINWRSTFDSSKGWYHKIPENITQATVSQKFIQEPFTNEVPHHIEEPTLIAPDLFKQNITLDIQNDPKSVLFKKIWNRVWEELNGIDVLIFIGFSFPDTDHHAKFLFGEAHSRQPFSKVIVNTKSDKSLTRYHSIFGKNTVISFTGGIQNMVSKKDKLISLLKL